MIVLTDLSDAAFVRLRLAAHRLAGAHGLSPTEVVAHLGAVQGQDYAASLWAVGVRVPRSTAADVESAIAAASIVRTWPIRGTLHLVAAADVRWMLRLMGRRKDTAARTRRTQLGLEDRDVDRADELAREALAGRKALARKDLYDVFDRAGLATQGQRGVHLTGALAARGLVCVGPRAGSQPTFVLLDDWVPPGPRDDLAGDEALAEIARRYFTSHGPATERDLAMWTGLPLGEVRRGIVAATAEHGHLDAVDVRGVRHWLAAGLEPQGAPVLLLPGFDEYVLAYRDRRPVVADPHSDLVAPGGNGVFRATVVAQGKVVGTWVRARRPATAGVAVEPFPGRRTPRIEAAAARYARFLG